MLSKCLSSKCWTAVLLLCIYFTSCEALPKFFCLDKDLPLMTITKKFDHKLLVTDHIGTYWDNLTDNSVFKSYVVMLRFKKFYLSDRGQFETKGMTTFDATFKYNLEGKCELKPEKLFALKLRYDKVMLFSISNGVTWTDPTELNERTDLRKYPMLQQALPHLNLSKRIKAIVNFKLNGFLFIQDQNLFYMYCGPNGWKIETNVSQKFTFENNYKIEFGQIFGGYVDQDNNVLYLFAGRLTSSKGIARRFVHKCDIQINEITSKMKLFCEKLVFKQYCNKSELSQDIYQKNIHIVVICAAILLIILLILMVYLLWKRCKTVKPTELSTQRSQQKMLADNRVRVIGEKSTKKTAIARTRTFEFTK